MFPKALFALGRIHTFNRLMNVVVDFGFWNLNTNIAFPKWWYSTEESARAYNNIH